MKDQSPSIAAAHSSCCPTPVLPPREAPPTAYMHDSHVLQPAGLPNTANRMLGKARNTPHPRARGATKGHHGSVAAMSGPRVRPPPQSSRPKSHGSSPRRTPATSQVGMRNKSYSSLLAPAHAKQTLFATRVRSVHTHRSRQPPDSRKLRPGGPAFKKQSDVKRRENVKSGQGAAAQKAEGGPRVSGARAAGHPSPARCHDSLDRSEHFC